MSPIRPAVEEGLNDFSEMQRRHQIEGIQVVDKECV